MNTLQPQPTLQPQQTTFNNNNPYGNDLFGQTQQQPPQDNFPHPGILNPWAANHQQSVDAIKPAPTGSNNPFASFNRNQVQIQKQQNGPPSLNTLAEQRTATQLNDYQSTSINPITNYQAPQPISNPPKAQNPQHARLNALLATGEGQDTFGNTGELRIPAQHTAPGIFVNSAGQGLERLRQAQTGNNPFFSQQFTGVPQHMGGNAGGFAGQQNNNPFGMQQQSYSHQGQQGGSLIDL
jgi:epsin